MYHALQIPETHSISAGLDYPGVGPEHAWLKDSGRAEYVAVTDKQALEGLQVYTCVCPYCLHVRSYISSYGQSVDSFDIFCYCKISMHCYRVSQ
jgi:hypothetical protein